MLNSDFVKSSQSQFENLPGFSFKSEYLSDLPGYEGLRLHYVDQGPRDSNRLVLCLHGQPTWSYLYRKMIPIFNQAGQRVIAPDFFGFGKSDKPIDENVYTFTFHRNTLISLIKSLPPKPITLVVQDWGGALGLTLTLEFPSQIDQLLIMNTALGTGEPLGEGFDNWRHWVKQNPDFQVSRLMKRSCPQLSEQELLAYDAPFTDFSSRAGLRMFPAIMPIRPEMEGVNISKKTRQFLKTDWRGKSFIAIGMKDPVFGPKLMENLAANIRGSFSPLKVKSGGHFLQEWGEAIAVSAIEAFKS